VIVDGKDITGCSALAAIEAGVGHIAEDRHARGLVLQFDLAENLSLLEYRNPEMSRGPFLSPRRLAQRARKLLSDYDVRGGNTDTPASSLSGGNQQKVVIARELSADPKVLIAAQPTRGLDVGAIEFVHRRLVEERDKGRAVLLVSLELEEVRSLSDRALVIYEGEIATELPPSASEEEFGVFMTGGGRREVVA
jgi:simple sugar transport system ATP-binding protein